MFHSHVSNHTNWPWWFRKTCWPNNIQMYDWFPTPLTASRPDIMFSTRACARYQSSPRESHLIAVKRIFRYLKGTPTLGIWYPANNASTLVAFSDSDYAGCKMTRKSTSGGCQFLGNCLVSWPHQLPRLNTLQLQAVPPRSNGFKINCLIMESKRPRYHYPRQYLSHKHHTKSCSILKNKTHWNQVSLHNRLLWKKVKLR